MNDHQIQRFEAGDLFFNNLSYLYIDNLVADLYRVALRMTNSPSNQSLTFQADVKELYIPKRN